MTQIESPCTKLCVIDPVNGFCRGCGRTIDEISAWSGLEPTDRLAVLNALPSRQAQQQRK